MIEKCDASDYYYYYIIIFVVLSNFLSY